MQSAREAPQASAYRSRAHARGISFFPLSFSFFLFLSLFCGGWPPGAWATPQGRSLHAAHVRERACVHACVHGWAGSYVHVGARAAAGFPKPSRGVYGRVASTLGCSTVRVGTTSRTGMAPGHSGMALGTTSRTGIAHSFRGALGCCQSGRRRGCRSPSAFHLHLAYCPCVFRHTPHRDWAHPRHTCTGTGLTPATPVPIVGCLPLRALPAPTRARAHFLVVLARPSRGHACARPLPAVTDACMRRAS
jgi:hypothetical protein